MIPLLWLLMSGCSDPTQLVHDLVGGGPMGSSSPLGSVATPAYVESMPFDVTKARYHDLVVDKMEMTEGERDMLARQGMVVVDHKQRQSFGSAYHTIYTSDLPVLVTTDSILHMMHRNFDDMLKLLESSVFKPMLDDLLTDAQREVKRRFDAGDTSNALGDVDVYLSVARSMLTTRTVVSSTGRQAEVEGITRSIARLKGGRNTLYGKARTIDYSQFEPRGHYTKSNVLKRYFRAMMWLGRPDTGFELSDPRQLEAAALLSMILDETGGNATLEQLDKTLSWLVGTSDNLGVRAMLDAIGSAGLSRENLSDPATLDALRGTLDGTQRIRSQSVIAAPAGSGPAKPPDLFQVFGQRFVLDAFVLSHLVFDSIEHNGRKVERMMPTGLDVAAALGNDQALRMLEPEFERFPYAHNMHDARKWVEAQPGEVWTASAYNIWLSALRDLDGDTTTSSNLPAAMRTEAWAIKQTQTQLASWAELRHDTLLYAKQSYSSVSCVYPLGYVEPYPGVYAAVRHFAQETRSLLDAMPTDTEEDVQPASDGEPWSAGAMPGLVTPAKAVQRVSDALGRMDEPLRMLELLANKELAGEPFTTEEETFLKRTIDKRGESGPPKYDGWYPSMFLGHGKRATEWSPEITDVHTDPSSGDVLQVGVGQVEFLVMAIDNDGDTAVYVGPSYSYYEFSQPRSERFDDASWAERLEHEAPPRPTWLKPILGDGISPDP